MVTVTPLADHPEVLPTLQAWFEAEWPGHYGVDGPGDAAADLSAFARRGELPVGVVAFCEGTLCGVAALKAVSISSHAQLTPWAAAGLVRPDLRGQGIGLQLLSALEDEARALGYASIHCASGTAARLFERAGWRRIDRIEHDGAPLAIYRKALTE